MLTSVNMSMKNEAPTSAKMTIPLLKPMIELPPTTVGDMVDDMVGDEV